ncbi:MAG TPA: chemotaxis response regulator protein-glutamate methylesterase [Rhodospirillales bacterium]|nr:chemotaxis response regulator protein-glutamate methylesterase [Rhodospirillales bacterium]
MMVDDSAVIRGLITRILEADNSIKVAVSVGNGELAVKNLSRYDIDVIVLDIEMPVMDGLTALPKLLEVDPGVKIIMAPTLTERNADISLRALEAGATDYIPKPTSSREISAEGDFRRELIDKVKALGMVRRRNRTLSEKDGRAKGPVFKAASVQLGPPHEKISLREPGKDKPDVLAIGSSTGGPQALFSFLGALKKDIKAPILITQHMPAMFTAILAEHINRMTGWPCSEAKDGEAIRAGHIHVAPGGYHMKVANKGPQRVISLNQDPPENFCRPAVDPMFRSAAKVFGSRVIGVVLTGMGSDGAKGGKEITQAGGTIVAQDEKSSVVWGMPGAVAAAGICSAVLPLDELASYVMKHAGGP